MLKACYLLVQIGMMFDELAAQPLSYSPDHLSFRNGGAGWRSPMFFQPIARRGEHEGLTNLPQ